MHKSWLRTSGYTSLCAVVVAAAIGLMTAAPVRGQSVQGDNTLGTVNAIDRTLTRGRLLGSGGGSSFSRGGRGASRLGFANPGSAAVSFRGRSSGGSAVRFANTRQLGQSVGYQFMMPFGRSPSAWSFSSPVYSGRVGYQPTLMPWVGGESVRRILRHDSELLGTRSFSNLVYLPPSGGAIRDELTNVSIANSPEIDLEAVARQEQQNSPAERFAARLAAHRERYLSQGWQALRDGDYRRADDSFTQANSLDRSEPEPLIGRILCATIEGRMSTASTLMERLYQQEDKPFALRDSLGELLPDTVLMAIPFDNLDRLAANPDVPPRLAALRVYLLWLNHEDDKALYDARLSRERFRGTVYADIGARMEDYQQAETQPSPDDI